MKRTAAALSTALILLTGILFAGCLNDNNGVENDDIGSPDDTAEGDASLIADACNRFALDLYMSLLGDDPDGNLFISPWSIHTALSMTYEGARSTTADEMREVLHLWDNDTSRRDSYCKMSDRIKEEDSEFDLYTANAIWPQEGFPFGEDFLGIIGNTYGSGVESVDYENDHEAARETINEWAMERTKDKIDELLPPGSVDPLTRLVLTNAIYFKGKWILPFDPDSTRDTDFRLADGSRIDVPMMSMGHEDAHFKYTETKDLQAIELPYDGSEISMTIILPKENDLGSLGEKLDIDMISDITDDLNERDVDLFLPRFEMTRESSLVTHLDDLGMVSAFGTDADFSGMCDTPLFISEVRHKAFIEVNEEGTEAAAATGVVMTLSADPSWSTFRADHPFIFLIRHRDTGNILFMGKVMDPTA